MDWVALDKITVTRNRYGNEICIITERCAVPGGWLVRAYRDDATTIALAFVPDPAREWIDGSGGDDQRQEVDP